MTKNKEGIAEHKVGVFIGALTFIGTIIGGGVVGLPIAVLYTGLPLGIVLNLLNAIGAIYAVSLLIKAKNITGLASYSELGYACFGRASIFLINAIVALATAGMPIAYFMIFGHICSPLLISFGMKDDYFWSKD
jgi:amino acid permease